MLFPYCSMITKTDLKHNASNVKFSKVTNQKRYGGYRHFATIFGVNPL